MRRTDPFQIEQFIESIFPTQKPPVDTKSPASVEEAAKKKKDDEEAKWDMIYMISAVVLTVGVITFFMVGLFDKVLPSSDANYSASFSLPGWPALDSILRTTSSKNKSEDSSAGVPPTSRRSQKSRRLLRQPLATASYSHEPLRLMFICILIAGAFVISPKYASKKL